MPTPRFGPLITAMVTPFTPSGDVDFPRAEELAARLYENGSTGLVLSGTTGESPTLTPQEKLELFRRVKSISGDHAIIANVGDNDTRSSAAFAQEAAKTGVDALLVVVPSYNKPSSEGMYQHFKTIAQSVDLPCILYNVPGRTSKNLDAATLGRLAADVPNIVGVKESSGDPVQWARYRSVVPDDFLIYSGNDSDTLPMLALGACGCISVWSHVVGKPFRRMMECFWDGELDTALQFHLRLLPVSDALFPPTSSNPAPVKAALELQGFPVGGLRLPLVPVTDAEREAVRKAMEDANVME